MCSPLRHLHRHHSLTVSTRIVSGLFCSSNATTTIKRLQHTAATTPSPLEKKIPGINDCPQNCLCSRGIEFSYKNPRFLSQFISAQTGMIIPRNITKLCMRKQKRLARTIKRARHMGFMPYTHKQEEYMNDPRLF